jgi:hypothetical protein
MPAKIAIADARNVNPATDPNKAQRMSTKARMPPPNTVADNPSTLAICRGRIENPVIMLKAWESKRPMV